MQFHLTQLQPRRRQVVEAIVRHFFCRCEDSAGLRLLDLPGAANFKAVRVAEARDHLLGRHPGREIEREGSQVGSQLEHAEKRSSRQSRERIRNEAPTLRQSGSLSVRWIRQFRLRWSGTPLSRLQVLFEGVKFPRKLVVLDLLHSREQVTVL